MTRALLLLCGLLLSPVVTPVDEPDPKKDDQLPRQAEEQRKLREQNARLKDENSRLRDELARMKKKMSVVMKQLNSLEPLRSRYETQQMVAREMREVGQNPGPVKPTGRKVTDATKLLIGQTLLVAQGGNWWAARILRLNDNGTIRIHYVGWHSGHDLDVPRSRLQLDPDAMVKAKAAARNRVDFGGFQVDEIRGIQIDGLNDLVPLMKVEPQLRIQVEQQMLPDVVEFLTEQPQAEKRRAQPANQPATLRKQ